MSYTLIKDVYASAKDYIGKEIKLGGWVKTVRASNNFGFVELNDGSFFKNIQIVFENDLDNYSEIAKQNVGAALVVTGTLVETPQAKQPFEVKASSICLEGASTPDFPLQKKRHSFEFLRTIAHLRPRTNTFNAVFRVRSEVAYAIHEFFHQKGFVYVHTPLITTSDCEGAGELFQVTSLDLSNIKKDEFGNVDYTEDFFGKKTGLTVSGQLAAETYAMAFRNVYTFGPTFRAEKSMTTRHAAEFWMIEPEMAFADLNDYLDLAEEMMKHIINHVFNVLPEEMAFFNEFVDKGLIERLQNVANSSFERITYTKAIEILEQVKDKFEFPVYWGADIQTEHERYLCEVVYKKPVYLTDYPKEIKSFYMKLNDDGKTVAAADLLVPGIGEIIGGSQREERYDVLCQRLQDFGLEEKDYLWYLDTRRYGSCKHAGYGLGFERCIMYITGMTNIRDVASFPRSFRSAEF